MRQKADNTPSGQRFNIVRQLGSGGFGAVYEAIEPSNGQRVALKELTRANPSALFNFKQEFRALAHIHHPNLVNIKELIEQEGRWYIVMELVDGQELLAFVRSGQTDLWFDEERVRQAFAGIAQGLEALHGHGILHRDLKPSNVIVTPEGRAALLDFGLATGVDPSAQSTQGMGAGTVAYMAPEQFEGAKLTRAADWYAFGTCLYEALTGRLPFEGDSVIQIAMDKQRLVPAAPRALVPGVPEDLSDLCMQLLRRSAEERPKGPAILQVLSGIEMVQALAPAAPSFVPEPIFTGREAELEHLEHALSLTHEGALRVVLVEGESGVGKSELVAEFLRKQTLRVPHTLSLRGRCYENEQVSYKAFDGCIDELARALKRMGAAAAPLMPANAGLLAQLFPVLADVPAIASARSDTLAADPTARRLQAFVALAALLSNLAEDRPLILVVDDLQWADAESFRLLRALFEHPEPPPMLLLATVRPRKELEPEVLASLDLVRSWHCADVIPILGLARVKAEELAATLLGPTADPKWASIIAIESRGHPLFLSELIHFTKSRELEANGALTLEAALRARIERLSPEARALLELVTLAARPHPAQLFARALGAERCDASVTTLLAAKLLRARRDQELVCFHDRVRHASVSLIASSRLPHLHRQLAQALSRDPEADPTELASHWDLAGEPEQASEAYEAAAEYALRAMAFSQAERMYARALELMGSGRNERYVELSVARAHAVACSGRSAEAATYYQHAAELTSGDARLRLRSRTAQHLLLSSQTEAGLAACRALLGELGVTLPRGVWGMLLRTGWDRLCMMFSGRRLLPPPVREDSARARLVLDLLYDLSGALSNVDSRGFQALTTQYLRRALAWGDPFHIASACADEGYLSSLRGRRERGRRFFEASKELSQAVAKPALTARLHLFEGAALIVRHDPAKSIEHLERAEALYQAHCADEPWSLTRVRYRLGMAWALSGRESQLAVKMDLWIQEARERQDHVAVAWLSGTGYGSMRHLMRGDPGLAMRELDEAFAHIPAHPFSFVHIGQLFGAEHALLVMGGRAACDWFETRRKAHDRASLLRLRFGKDPLTLLRAGAALGACEVARPSEREALCRAARSQAGGLLGREVPFIQAMAAQLLAQVEALEGATERALVLARTARVGLAKINHAWAHAASYLEGLLEEGEGGRQKCSAALAFYAAQGWKEPRDAMMPAIPALRALAQSQATTKPRRTQVIHHYEVLQPLASGGFGSVVEARDLASGRHVALKELVANGGRSLARFKQEFRALQDLNHPNLVRFEALFEYQSRWYIAMELVRGTDLLSFVRPGGTLDPSKLRQALGGLLEGVQALHEAGFIHRDISPENVCVTAEGRAVLLDFGLIARAHDGRDTVALGNADYAAPEQLEGCAPHASADVYALGSCLYQALSGRKPFEASDAGALIDLKRMRAPRALPTSEQRPLVLACKRMLTVHPAQRPALGEVIALLHDTEGATRPSQRPSLALLPDPAAPYAFAGRKAELAQLAAAAQWARAQFTLALVEGESGLGKSALVAEFARQREDQDAELLVLGARCYENELMALKAFDGVVDQLALALRTMPAAECDALLPKKAALLAQLFPVLGSVPAIASASKKGLPADPGARRILGLSCFVALLEQLARRSAVLLVIDDLQWADAESLRLLHTLSSRGEALPLLIVATMRPRQELSRELQGQVEALGALTNTHTLRLGQLSADDVRILAESLIGGDAEPDLLRQVSAESKGHPLFLRELIEHAKSGASSMEGRAASLDDALRARMARFDGELFRLMALVALAGRPHPSQVFAAALGYTELPVDSLNQLLNQGLLRRRGQDSLTCYHDRIRHAALAVLPPAEWRELSGRLAGALDAMPGSEPAERARLWDQADNRERAVEAYEQAGNAALAKLAFVEAEHHYARAMELAVETRDDRFRTLTIQRAHALVRMGKNAEAAQFYIAAAASAEGELKVRLRVWAAQNLIQGAQVKEGLAAASALLRELGVPMPKTERQALRRIAWEGVRLKLRGLDFKPAPGQDELKRRLVLIALNELSQPVASVLLLEGSALSAQHLRRALEGGDPAHAARALAHEGALRSARAPKADHSALFERASELAHSTRDPAVIAAVEIRQATACFGPWNFAAARQLLRSAHERVLSQCPDHPWLLVTARAHLGFSLMYLGDYQALASHAEEWVGEARERGDRYAYAALVTWGFGFLRHLMRDDPTRARAELDEAMAPWPKEPFSTNHFGALQGIVMSHLWRGGAGALEWFEQNDAWIERAFFARTLGVATVISRMRAAACLAAMDGLSGERNQRLLSRARSELGALQKGGAPGAAHRAQLLGAVLLALSGKREQALQAVRTSHAGFVRMNYHQRDMAAFLEGFLEGGDTGRAKCEATLAGLRAQGWVDPMKFISVPLPVFHLLPSE